MARAVQLGPTFLPLAGASVVDLAHRDQPWRSLAYSLHKLDWPRPWRAAFPRLQRLSGQTSGTSTTSTIEFFCQGQAASSLARFGWEVDARLGGRGGQPHRACSPSHGEGLTSYFGNPAAPNSMHCIGPFGRRDCPGVASGQLLGLPPRCVWLSTRIWGAQRRPVKFYTPPELLSRVCALDSPLLQGRLRSCGGDHAGGLPWLSVSILMPMAWPGLLIPFILIPATARRFPAGTPLGRRPAPTFPGHRWGLPQRLRPLRGRPALIERVENGCRSRLAWSVGADAALDCP